jgi:hypothetical protein
MAEEEPRVKPSLGAVLTNWRRSDLPFLSKLQVSLRNNWTKARTRQNCCGNLGDPGC